MDMNNIPNQIKPLKFNTTTGDIETFVAGVDSMPTQPTIDDLQRQIVDMQYVIATLLQRLAQQNTYNGINEPVLMNYYNIQT